MNYYSSSYVAAGLLLLGAWVNSHALASSSDDANLFDLTLVELSQLHVDGAAKYPEKISEIPASVYIVTRREIEQSGYDSLIDILQSVPGLFFMDTYANVVSGLRGIAGTGGSDMVFLVNGIEQTRDFLSFIAVPVESIDRVEIIRGPMSVIYGNGAFLGAVNIITNDYSQLRKETVVGVSGDSIDGNRAGIHVGGDTNDFRFKANLATHYSAGIDADYSEMMSATQQAGLIPDGAHTSTYKNLEATHWTANVVGEIGSYYGQLQRDHINKEAWIVTASFNEGNRSTTDSLIGSFGYRQTVNKQDEVRLELRYNRLSEKFNYDILVPDQNGTTHTKQQELHIEATYLYHPNEALELLLGANFTRYFNRKFNINIPALGSIDPNFDYVNEVKDSNRDIYAVYARPKYHVTNNLILVAGLRVEKEMDYSKTVTGDTDLPTLELGRHDIESKDDFYFIPRIAAIYDINQTHLFKALYGEANKSEDGISGSVELLERRQKAKTLEFNYQYVTEHFLLSSSLFHTKLEDLPQFFQTFDPVDGFQTETRFSGSETSDGIELWLRFTPLSNLSLDVSATHSRVESSNTDATVGNAPLNTVKLKSVFLQNYFQFSLEARYTDALYPDWSFIYANGDVFRAEQKVDSYWVADANVRFEPLNANFALNFRIENLADTAVRYPASANASFYSGLIGPGRTWILTGHYYFD